jgi:hypothetical protein
MNLSPRLLAYKPRSDYFKQRWGDALAWVEEHKENGTGQETEGHQTANVSGGHRTTVRGPRKRSLRLATGKLLGYNDAHDLPLVQPIPGLYADGI